MERDPKQTLKEWLDKLQQESWQLELIISGFAIFLILGMNDPINNLIERSLRISFSSTRFGSIFMASAILKAFWFVTLLNLVIHLAMRSLWISTIGLRYVSRDIDLDSLNFAPKFDRFFRKRLRPFDDYIEGLEKICSTIFAFTFLLLFVIISLALYFLFMDLSSKFLTNLGDQIGIFGATVIKVIRIVLLLFAFIYFVDFVSLGAIKRIRGFSKIYFPFYRFYSWITLAPFYRPLYYNLVDNRFGRRVGLLILPYSIIALFGSSLKIDYGKFFPPSEDPHFLNGLHYVDEFSDIRNINMQEFTHPFIPSKYIEGNFLEVFLPYNGTFDNQALLELCPDLSPAKKERITLRGAVNIDFSNPPPYDPDSLINCFSEMHRIYLGDSLVTDPDLMFYQHPVKNVPGLLSILDISHLPEGKNTISIAKFGMKIAPRNVQIDNQWQEPVVIPFWKISR